ncbi:MAG: type II toxin-antitoxin system VapC family toxin [Planctomycetes bacterium]|nr:type II toxin-antitoxin system VapC family toxin [Planctomycetota bacterium]MBM4083773.1 type II toxin-antitoxin system VapC family toxin [Planctomycetota bacterium]
MRATVFDSHAVLALFFEEPGAEQLEEILHEAAVADRPVLITAVNWAEVLYRMKGRRGDEGVEAAKRFERTMPVDVVPADLALAELAADFKAAHKLSVADAFAAALTKQRNAELVTGDPDFKAVEGELKKVRWLG